MKSFKEFLSEELLFEEELFEAADDASKPGGASNNTKGVLHELITGYHLNGGKHMEDHKLVHPTSGAHETPTAAHKRLKASIHPADYKRIHDAAKSAATDIRSQVEASGHKISRVRHTSKPGDTEKETNIPATQKQDSSDIYVTTMHPKTGEETSHGISLKVSDRSSKNVPSSSLGMKSSGSKAQSIFKEHQAKIKEMHPALATMGPDARKDWAKKYPKKHAQVKAENLKLLHKVAQHHAAELQNHLNSGNHEHVIAHARDVLAAKKTPAQAGGTATFRKHTTYRTAKGTQHHTADPSESHEHILSDHKNISVESSGVSVHLYHTDPKTGIKKKFATQSHKLDSQSDPLSTLKSAGKAT